MMLDLAGQPLEANTQLGGPWPAGRRDAGCERAPDDTRFRDILGAAAWDSLPDEVRRRFSKHLAPGTATVYCGRVVLNRHSRVGALLAYAARLAGGPLPLPGPAGSMAIVTVTETPSMGGQVWTRLYARDGGFPQVISTAKRFAGPTGLMEYLGTGLAMHLAISAEQGDLVFRSTRYTLTALGRTIPLPRLLAPGTCEVRHRSVGDRRFVFSLALTHPWLGCLIRQDAEFEE